VRIKIKIVFQQRSRFLDVGFDARHKLFEPWGCGRLVPSCAKESLKAWSRVVMPLTASVKRCISSNARILLSGKTISTCRPPGIIDDQRRLTPSRAAKQLTTSKVSTRTTTLHVRHGATYHFLFASLTRPVCLIEVEDANSLALPWLQSIDITHEERRCTSEREQSQQAARKYQQHRVGRRRDIGRKVSTLKERGRK
jgi:hypothetical protein